MTEKIELELSSYIKHRAELMKSLEIPTISEAKNTLGEELAKMVFDQCNESLKEDFGLKPPLKGIWREVWTSPSDLLKGKIALVPPYTRKHVQALTHQGILTIGAGIEKKFLYEAEIDKENALAHQKKELLDSFQDNIMAEIKDVEARERAACQRELDKLTNEFAVTLNEELNKLEDTLREEYNTIIESQEQILQTKWEEKLNLEVANTVRTLTKEFLEEIQKQEESLSKEFKLELRKAEMKKAYDIGIERVRFDEKMRQLRHKIECDNIANLMCILCMERRKCQAEKSAIESYYKIEIANLTKRVSNERGKIKELTKSLEESHRMINLRETCILEILKQYQKFVNFALKAAPTQAEFLLSIEKLMVFELTENLLKSDITLTPLCEPTLKWKGPSEERQPLEPNLELNDGHNCLNEKLVPSPDAILPALIYNKKLYIREEFQNIASKLYENDNAKDIWLGNEEDVQMLISLMKDSIGSGQNLVATKPSKGRSSMKFQSSAIQFKSTDNKDSTESKKSAERDTITSVTCKKSKSVQKKALKTSVSSTHRIDYGKIGSFENKANLLGTKSSLEIIKDKSLIKRKNTKESNAESDDVAVSTEAMKEEMWAANRRQSFDSVRIFPEKGMPTIKNSQEEKDIVRPRSVVLETKDSVALAKVSELMKDITLNFNVSPKDSVELKLESDMGLKKKISKLTSARDSVEIAKESLHKLRVSPECKNKQGKRDSGLGGSVRRTSASLTCYDKCLRMKQSVEVMDGILAKKTPEDAADKLKGSSDIGRALRLSHIEVINVTDPNKSQVAFDTLPTLITDDRSKIVQMYKPPQANQSKTTAKRKPKDRFISQAPAAAIIGDSHAKEYLQTTQQFTDDRIRSFISLIKDHPNLIRTFTACRR